MFAQKKTSTDIPYIDGLFPRGLIASGRDVFTANTTFEGLCPLRIHFERGFVKGWEVLNNSAEPCLKLILPRLIEPHAHIDKAFTWTSSPNLSGTYQEALKANLEELKDRSIQKVKDRASRALDFSLKNGLRAVRTHVDSFGLAGDYSWEALIEIKNDWKSLIELQLVALVPLEFWDTNHGEKLAIKVAKENGFLGGVIAPPYDKKKLKDLMICLLDLANRLGCGVDLHIDETDLCPGRGLSLLLNTLDQMKVDVPITCSHLSSMGLMRSESIQALADRLAYHQVNVVALPLTNFWLLAKRKTSIPSKRPFAPIKELQAAGVTVAVGGDNVQDPWYPAGNFDPLSLMAASISMAHLVPWTRLGLSTFTTAPARLMGLKWDGSLDIGSPADLVLLEADSWSVAMSSPPQRKVMIKGQWI